MTEKLFTGTLRINQPTTSRKEDYRKVPKFSDARKLCCNLPEIQTKSPNIRVFCQKDANGRATSEDPDLKEQSFLGLHCLPRPVCPKTLNPYGTS